MDSRYRLHYAPDNASLIVRLALEEIGVPYATALVDRAARAHKTPAYLALNPSGLIPVLETPDGAIFETGAILLWLADRHGKLAPLPDSPDRATFLKWLFFLSNTLHVALRMRFYPDQYVGGDRAAQAQLQAHLKGEIATHLTRLEDAAAARPVWFCAETPSCLDLYLACLLRWADLYPAADRSGWFSLGDWPLLQAMAARLEHRQSVKAAIKAEGLGAFPFTAPDYATPPEGSAT